MIDHVARFDRLLLACGNQWRIREALSSGDALRMNGWMDAIAGEFAIHPHYSAQFPFFWLAVVDHNDIIEVRGVYVAFMSIL